MKTDDDMYKRLHEAAEEHIKYLEAQDYAQGCLNFDQYCELYFGIPRHIAQQYDGEKFDV